MARAVNLHHKFKDDDKFLTLARTAVAAAGSPPYATELARRGYDSAKLAALSAQIAAFDAARLTARSLVDAGVGATKARDDAFEALSTWLLAFDGAVALESRNDTTLKARLG